MLFLYIRWLFFLSTAVASEPLVPKPTHGNIANVQHPLDPGMKCFSHFSEVEERDPSEPATQSGVEPGVYDFSHHDHLIPNH